MGELNLGDKIRKIKEDIAAEEKRRLDLEKDKEAVRIARERSKIEEIFIRAWDKTLLAIEESRVPSGTKVRYSNSDGFTYRGFGNFYAVAPDDARHPHHDIFQRWSAKAQENGILLKISYEHDGMGMESWYTVNFTI